jgi:hypothetical protein
MEGELMPQARFVMDFDDAAGRPTLPTDDAHGFTVDGDGVDGHGYVTCSYTPTENTCIVLVSASEAVIDAMKDHADFEWLEDV